MVCIADRAFKGDVYKLDTVYIQGWLIYNKTIGSNLAQNTIEFIAVMEKMRCLYRDKNWHAKSSIILHSFCYLGVNREWKSIVYNVKVVHE